MKVVIPETTGEWEKETEWFYRLRSPLVKGIITYMWTTEKWQSRLNLPSKVIFQEYDTLEEALEGFPKLIDIAINSPINTNITINQIQL